MPPMAITSRMPMTSRIEFFSRTWCRAQKDMMRAPLLGGLQGGATLRRLDFADLNGLPYIPRHDQRADDEQRAACRTDHVEGVHRLDCLDERIFEEAERGVG